MGQRHQIFLIAKIVPRGETDAKYRCVVANHHTWCYGRLPLQATRRFLTLIKKQEHAQIIREELRSLDCKYGPWQQDPPVPAIAAPFSWFLLTTSFNVNLNPSWDDLVVNGHATLDANLGSTDTYNDDGITVIDITNPQDPAYCFMTGTIPLSAADYVRAYYPESETEDDPELAKSVLGTIAALEGERMVTLRMLSETWPGEYEAFQADDEKDLISESVVSKKNIACLSDLTLAPAVNRAIETEDVDGIEQLLWLPNKAQDILFILKARDSLPDTALLLLIKAMDHLGKDIFDFSNFPLTGTQIVSICAQLHDVHALDLSHNSHVTADTIQSLLESLPMLRRLVVLDTSVTEESLCSLLHTHPNLFCNLEAVVHPLFLHADRKHRYPNAFAIIKSMMMTGSVSTGSLPFFTPSLVVQAVSDFMKGLSLALGMSVDSQAAVSSTIRSCEEPWTARTIPLIASDSFEGAINGEGWIFASDFHGMVVKYGFIKTRPMPARHEGDEKGEKNPTSNEAAENSVTTLLDLDGFLDEMRKEGRSPAPAAAVDTLRNFFKDVDITNKDYLTDTKKHSVKPPCPPCQMMDATEANNFVRYLRARLN